MALMSYSQTVRVILSVAFLCLPVVAQQQIITGKVVAVIDGDIFTIRDANKAQHVVQLIGVDAPESNQAFGDKARQSLSDLINGKTVTVTGSKRDRHDRIVGKVTLNNKDIGLEQIKRGAAWFFRQYANELSRDDAKAYEQAEDEARAKQRGLWAGIGPIPPWELRAAQGKDGVGGLPAITAAPVQELDSTVIGDRLLMIYHTSDCPDFTKVPKRNQVSFRSEAEAKAAGYKKAQNCPQ
jgi:endonuclease YncB( thermonuclease family)